MNGAYRWAIASLLVLSVGGCAPKGDAGAESSPAKAKKAATKAKKRVRQDGEIHVARQRKRVVPFILHQPSLDLRVQCLGWRDAQAEQGNTVPLCFDEAERAVETAVKTIRIEHREGMRIADSIKILRSRDEAAHFVVDDNGTPYQLLDLALSARRAETYQRSELRVVSGHAEGHAKLVTALKLLYPKLAVNVVEPLAAKAEPKPRAAKPSAPAPATP